MALSETLKRPCQAGEMVSKHHDTAYLGGTVSDMGILCQLHLFLFTLFLFSFPLRHAAITEETYCGTGCLRNQSARRSAR
jgi:hypothetical protein